MKKLFLIFLLIVFIFSCFLIPCYAEYAYDLQDESYYVMRMRYHETTAETIVLVHFAPVDVVDNQLVYAQIETIGYLSFSRISFTLSYSYMDKNISFYVVSPDTPNTHYNVSLNINGESIDYVVNRRGYENQEIKCYISFPENFVLGSDIIPYNEPVRFNQNQHNTGNTLLYTLTNDYIRSIKQSSNILVDGDEVSVIGYMLVSSVALITIYVIFRKILRCFSW